MALNRHVKRVHLQNMHLTVIAAEAQPERCAITLSARPGPWGRMDLDAVQRAPSFLLA